MFFKIVIILFTMKFLKFYIYIFVESKYIYIPIFFHFYKLFKNNYNHYNFCLIKLVLTI